MNFKMNLKIHSIILFDIFVFLFLLNLSISLFFNPVGHDKINIFLNSIVIISFLYSICLFLIYKFIDKAKVDEDNNELISDNSYILSIVFAFVIILYIVNKSNILKNIDNTLLLEYMYLFLPFFSLSFILIFKKIRKYFILAFVLTSLIVSCFYIYSPYDIKKAEDVKYEDIFRSQGLECKKIESSYFGKPHIKKGDEILTMDNKKEISENNIYVFCEDVSVKRFYFIDNNKIYKREKYLSNQEGENKWA